MTSGVTALIVVPPVCIVALVVRPWLGLASPWGLFHSIAALAAMIMVNWAYWRTVLSDPGAVRPGDWQSGGGGPPPRMCNKCNVEKPPRAHHCSVCKACRLGFDHHCPFVANCVALRNRRFFVQFLAWAVVGLAWANAVLAARMLALRDAGAEPLDTLTSAALVLGGVILFPLLLSLLCLLGFHVNLLRTDMTTIDQNQWESRQAAEQRHYANGGEPLVVPPGFLVAPVVAPSALGWRANCLAHCGPAPLLWFLPLHDEISSGRALERGGSERHLAADDGSGSEAAAPRPAERVGNRLPHQLV